ncbi:MAG: plastocyanin [Gammaproteobacteria bacterium]|jgi:plastocyanin
MKYLIFMFFISFSGLVAAERPVFEVSIKDHHFVPDTIEIPAGTKIKLLVKNLDPTPEEFESHELNREKIIAGNSEAKIFLGPLDPGEYGFFGEFNEDTAQGKIIVK